MEMTRWTAGAITRAEFKRRMSVGTRWNFFHDFRDNRLAARPVDPALKTREVMAVRSRDIVLRTEKGSNSYLAFGEQGETYHADGEALIVDVPNGPLLRYERVTN